MSDSGCRPSNGLPGGSPAGREERRETDVLRMSFRRERVSHFIRDVVGDAIANRISDPRVSRFTSVTRVEMSADMKFADVYVSIMGEENEARTTMKGLNSARGMIQTRLAKQINVRQCPSIRFHLDVGIKKALDTFRQMAQDASHQAGEEAAPHTDEEEIEGAEET